MTQELPPINETPTASTLNPIRPVPFFEVVENSNKLRCRVCDYFCELEPGQSGVCKVRSHTDGQLIANNYGLISRADLEPIENRRFRHFFPGARIFTIGGYGQNFPAIGQEDQYALPGHETTQRVLPVERIIKFTIARQCRGVVFGFNEPTMWYEYLSEAVRLVKANGMFVGIITNGYFSPEVLENIGHYVDGIRLEVNAFSEPTFKTLTGQGNFQRILETATKAQRRFKIHLEINTRLVPGVNDGENELRITAAWIKQVLGANTPWHISSAIPDNDELLAKIKQIGENNGLNYIYRHPTTAPGQPETIPDEDTVPQHSDDNTAGGHTYCYNCHRLIISRLGSDVRQPGIQGTHCAYCNTELGIHNTIWKL